MFYQCDYGRWSFRCHKYIHKMLENFLSILLLHTPAWFLILFILIEVSFQIQSTFCVSGVVMLYFYRLFIYYIANQNNKQTANQFTQNSFVSAAIELFNNWSAVCKFEFEIDYIASISMLSMEILYEPKINYSLLKLANYWSQKLLFRLRAIKTFDTSRSRISFGFVLALHRS